MRDKPDFGDVIVSWERYRTSRGKGEEPSVVHMYIQNREEAGAVPHVLRRPLAIRPRADISKTAKRSSLTHSHLFRTFPS